MLAALLALVAFQSQAKLPPVSKTDASKLAELFEAALIDPRAASALEKHAGALQAKYDFASLVAALRDGPALPSGEPKPRGKGKKAEKLERFGSVQYGFTFASGDDTFRYGVDVPAKYDPREPAPLLIDPGHGSGAKESDEGKAGFLAFYRGQCDAAGLENALIVRTEIVEQIGVDGLRGARPEDDVALVFDACFRDLASRFAIDLERVFVAGLSQTGFWAWQLGQARADRFAGIAPMSAVSFQQRFALPNFTQLSVFVLHGDADPICPIAQPRETVKQLEQLGVRVRFDEIAGAKHELAVWAHLNEGLRWIAERPRAAYPQKLAKTVQTLRQPWCYSVRLDRIAVESSGEAGQPMTASVFAERDGQVLRITSKGVEALTIGLASEMLDLVQPVTITWNERKAFEGLPKRDFARAASVALEKVDWRGTFEAFVELRGGK
ncbi:MAG: hypothetical protein IT454_19750 [Planctomycetes bacterium]|nr:hypothetical protein [Planctomycetota bacterium]